MFIPNKKYTITRNVKDYLAQGQVGKVITAKEVAKAIGESDNRVSGSISLLAGEGHLELAYVRKNLKYYKVLNSIGNKRPGDEMRRKALFTKGKNVNGSAGDFKVEKNISIPETAKKTKYPFGEMKKGDSFKFPLEMAKKVTSASYHYGKKHDVKFVCKKIGSVSMRCWRVS